MTSQVEARSAGTYSTTDIGSRRLDRVSVVESAFDTWQPRGGDRVDLVFATTAWHWLDPAVRYEQAWRLLRPGGHLPRYVERRHVFPGDGDPFFVELEEVYDEMAGARPTTQSGPARVSCLITLRRSKAPACSQTSW
jgi:SAM-dependent methyltransferase